MSRHDSRKIEDAKVVLVKGENGSSIDTIEKTSTSDLTDTYTITLTDGSKTTFAVTNGNYIESVEKTSTVGLTDTYTITMADGTTFTFTVRNGENGGGASWTGVVAPVEDSNVSAHAYEVGDFLIVDEQLYEVTDDISVGDTLAIGTNIKTSLVGDEIKGLKAKPSGGDRREKRDITDNLANLTQAIAEQDLEKYGYAIGDYFVGASGCKYYLADMDTFYSSYSTYASITTHHIAIVAFKSGWASVWAGTSSNTKAGYVNSTLKTFLQNTVLEVIKTDLTTLFGDWSEHLLKHQKYYTGACGTLPWSASTCAWNTDQYISALTETQVFGANILSYDGYQTGEAHKHLELFRKFSYTEFSPYSSFWLRSIASDTQAIQATTYGMPQGYSSASNGTVVGLILFH